MYKNILCVALLTVMTTRSITLGPNLLNNSTADYLIDIAKSLNDPEATLLIGQELYSRNYIDTIPVYDQVQGNVDEMPVTPGSGQTFDEGMWVWVADTVYATTGTWYWIFKTTSSYMAFFATLAIPIID